MTRTILAFNVINFIVMIFTKVLDRIRLKKKLSIIGENVLNWNYYF